MNSKFLCLKQLRKLLGITMSKIYDTEHDIFKLQVIYGNLTAYSSITTLIVRGEAEFNICCNRNVYFPLD